MKSIRQQFLATAVAIVIFLMALGFFTQLSFRRSMQNNQLSRQLDHLAFLEASLSKTERDFLLFESVNPQFFQTGQSRYVVVLDSLSQDMETTLNNIRDHRIIRKIAMQDHVDQIHQHYETLTVLFASLVDALHEYGYENHGLSGEMRRSIHQVEQTLSAENQHELTAMMLMLRRHEKDFMLRKDARYLDKFDQSMKKFLERMEQLDVNHNLSEKAKAYQSSFHALARKEKEIGTSANEGILFQINQEFANARPLIQQVQQKVDHQTESQTRLYIIVLVIAFVVISTAIVSVYSGLSRKIVHQILSLSEYINRLGKGQLPEAMSVKKQDEIGEMMHSVNTLTHNLRNTRDFALEVGKGNFTTEINVFENKGELGESLVKMKDQLEELANQQAKQREEEKQRTFMAEGTALFAQVLRENSDDLAAMAFMVIKNMVNYMEMTQGGLFTVEKDEGSQMFLLKGCYAYDRKKFFEKKIEWGEGLIGACALEKEPVYITDLPQDYIHITSGLGDVPPDCLLIVPLLHEDTVYGVMELAAFGEVPGFKQEFAFKIAESIASHIAMLNTNKQTEYLLQKSEEMAENLKQQEEELKQNMEEMKSTQEEADREIERLKREIAEKNKIWIENNLINKDESVSWQ